MNYLQKEKIAGAISSKLIESQDAGVRNVLDEFLHRLKQCEFDLSVDNITSVEQLEIDRYYWVLSKKFRTLSIEKCVNKNSAHNNDANIPTHLGDQWCTADNHQSLFTASDVFGPVPMPWFMA